MKFQSNIVIKIFKKSLKTTSNDLNDKHLQVLMITKDNTKKVTISLDFFSRKG